MADITTPQPEVVPQQTIATNTVQPAIVPPVAKPNPLAVPNGAQPMPTIQAPVVPAQHVVAIPQNQLLPQPAPKPQEQLSLLEQAVNPQKVVSPKQETVNKVLEAIKENPSKSYAQLYAELAPKPEYDSKRANRIQQNENLSVLSDIIKLVGEGATTKAGGNVIQRQSAVPNLNAQLQQLNDLYKQESDTYNTNKLKFGMEDVKAENASDLAQVKANALLEKEAEKLKSDAAKSFAKGEITKAQLAEKKKEADDKLALAKKGKKETHRHNVVTEGYPRGGENSASTAKSNKPVPISDIENVTRNLSPAKVKILAQQIRQNFANEPDVNKASDETLVHTYGSKYLKLNKVGTQLQIHKYPQNPKKPTTTTKGTVR